MLRTWPRRQIVPAFRHQLERKIGTHAVDLRKVFAQHGKQRGADVEVRRIGLPLRPPARRRQEPRIMAAPRPEGVENRLDPDIAGGCFFLAGC